MAEEDMSDERDSSLLETAALFFSGVHEDNEEEGQEERHHHEQHGDLIIMNNEHIEEEDEENRAPTGFPTLIVEEDQFLVEGGSNAIQLSRIQKGLKEAKSIAKKAIELAIEVKKETKETIEELEAELEATKEKLSDLTDRLENNFSHHNNNRVEENSNSNTANPSPNDFLSQTVTLSADTYALMMTNEVFSRSWFLGLGIFSIQISLLGLIFGDQVKSSEGSSMFNIPFKVSANVRIAQFLAMFLSIMISYDIFMPIKELSLLWITNEEWIKIVDVIKTDEYRTLREIQRNSLIGRPASQRRKTWLVHIFLPLLLKFIQGMLALLITFVIVIQSDDILGLFMDLAAMQVISDIDNVASSLASHGFFGYALKRDSDTAKRIEVKDKVRKICFGLPLRPIVMMSLLIMMMGTFVGLVVIGQVNGTHFEQKYPNCKVRIEQINNITDGKCNGGLQNTFQCGFDGGDCLDFNIAFPKCQALNAYEVGDGTCQEEHDVEECGYDGGDCCDKRLDSTYLKDGECNGGLYNSIYCGYDNGDCDLFRDENPLCPDLNLSPEDLYKDDGSPIVLGDGVCEFIPEYMTEECGYEYGDCSDCIVKDLSKLGNGICNGGLYNTKACGFDVGDCEKCNSIIDDSSRMGNGICDGGQYNTDACDWDLGDCFCINEAANGECDKSPTKMLVECEASCKISPLMSNADNDAVFQLRSTSEPSLCLTASNDGDDFARVIYSQCSTSNLNQDFFMKNRNTFLSGEIHSLKSLKSKSCLQMIDANPFEGYSSSVIMHHDCTDTWEILESGVLKNIARGKCIGRDESDTTTRIITVDCESEEVEVWSVVDSQYELFNVHFKTVTGWKHSVSDSSFEIDGYGEIPTDCHDHLGAECDIQIYGVKMLTIRAKGNDAWGFTITGDIGELLSYDTVPNGEHRTDFEVIDNNEFDVSHTYALKMHYNDTECYDVHFKTLIASNTTSNDESSFTIDGYGQVPSKCYSKPDAECDVQICGRRTLVLRTYTTDQWQFEISGDAVKLREYKTVPGGTHQSTVTMDVDEYDYLQVYDLYSSCIYRAFNSGECITNAKYIEEQCGTICKFMPLYNGHPVQLISTSKGQPSMCLTATENSDYSGLHYSSCNGTNPDQYFILEREENNYLVLGRFRTLSDDDYCVEMQSTHTIPIHLHKNCSEAWEIRDDGILKNIEDGKCLGKDEKNLTEVSAVDCNSKDVEALSLFDPNLHPSWDDFIFVHKTNYTTPEEIIEASFFYHGATNDSWIAIYPASADPSSLPPGKYMWQYACGRDWDFRVDSTCQSTAKSGIAVFSRENVGWPDVWPLDTGEWRIHMIDNQSFPFKAVLSSDVFSVTKNLNILK